VPHMHVSANYSALLKAFSLPFLAYQRSTRYFSFVLQTCLGQLPTLNYSSVGFLKIFRMRRKIADFNQKAQFLST
jgi:hypothetical protein